MKTIRGTVGGLVTVGFITSNFTAHAQPRQPVAFASVQEIQSVSTQTEAPDSVVRIAAEVKGLSVVPAKELPRNGTFWLGHPGRRISAAVSWSPRRG